MGGCADNQKNFFLKEFMHFVSAGGLALSMGEIILKSDTVAHLLKVDEQKFSLALINHCTTQEGTTVTLRHTKTEAETARDALACGIYFRIMDWIVTFINQKFYFTSAVFSANYSITLMDLFGFECFKKNGLEQLFINTLNEQLQCHYNQHIFVWEMQDQEAEEISAEMLYYYDNKPTVDELMAKPDGLFHLLDEATKTSHSSDFLLGLLDRYRKSSKLQVLGDEHEFSIAHCTGKVLYDARDMAVKNQHFLSPEMVDTISLSSDKVVKCLFTNQLSRTGNLIMSAEQCGVIANTNRERWGAALITGNTCRAQKFHTESQGKFSQTRQMQTAVATYRAISLEILRGAGISGTHFVRCIRTDLTKQPRGFHHDLVRQQLRALAVLDTAQARQKGYSHRIPFSEFICRYKFLAFDFDETVDITKDNSRLLLVRLKLEGWAIGKSKVFLKYYHVEYLARLYETQVKKIIKVQSMMRAFLAKRNIAANMHKIRKNSGNCITEKEVKNKQKISKTSSNLTEESASVIIQKQYRGYRARKELGIKTKRETNVNAMEQMQKYYRRWKSKTIFQVLLMYRAARQQDLVYFSQQVHIYNQNAMGQLNKCSNISISLSGVECGAVASLLLGNRQPTVWKLPIHLQQDYPYFDTAYLKNYVISGSDIQESWDAPLQKLNLLLQKMDKYYMKDVTDKQVQTSFSPIPEEHEPHEQHFIHVPFCRDPKHVSAEKSLKDRRETPNNQNTTSEQTVCPPLCVTQYKRQGNFGHKKPEVYNPGKARHLGRQRQEPDNHSTDMENNIVHDTISMCDQRNIIPPTPQQAHKGSGDIPNNRNSQNIKNSAELRQCSGYIRKESTTAVEKQLLNLENNNKGHVTGSYQPGTLVGETDYSKKFITEMEMKGKQFCDSEETDEPPFNFQAMLRKTNINRASLRRNTNSTSETAAEQTFGQKQNKNFSVNEEDNLRSKSTTYNNINTPEHTQNTYSSIKSWNGVENSSDSNKFASLDSLNRNEYQIKTRSQKPWDENHLDLSESMKPQSIYKKHRRLDSNRPSLNNEQHSSKNGPNFRNSLNKYEDNSYRESRSQLEDETRKTTTTKLDQSESMKPQSIYKKHGRLDSNRPSLNNEQHASKNGPNFRNSLNKCEDNSYRESRSQLEDETRKTTTTELVPGLIIQGKVTEL